jgi:hypothetical protein
MAESQAATERETEGRPSAGAEAIDTMRQLFGVTKSVFPGMTLQWLGGHRSFEASRNEARATGPYSVRVDIRESEIAYRVALLEAPGEFRISAVWLFTALSKLNSKWRVLEPADSQKRGWKTICLELPIAAKPMTPLRENPFVSDLGKVLEMVGELQAQLPALAMAPELEKLYESVADLLEPVMPVAAPGLAVAQWAQQTFGLLLGGSSVALAHTSPIVGQYGLAALADAAWQGSGSTVGLIRLHLVNARGLIEIANKAPGVVVVPVERVSLAGNPYDWASEAHAILSTLGASGRAAVITGTMGELQAAFGGGQGGASDPLRPAVQHVPPVVFEHLARFAVQSAGRAGGGLSPAATAALTRDVLEGLEGSGPAERERLLPMLVARMVHAWSTGCTAGSPLATGYVASLRTQRETLAGLSPRPRASRSQEVQERLTRAFSGGGVADHLKQHLIGQDAAIDELALRLSTECLTRPSHQPLRWCAVGPPGGGKTASAALLASHAGIPYVNIDMAAIPDTYTAASSLLGAARGIVGSQHQGLLEQAAKHDQGCLVEISDLDHAPHHVRQAAGDICLKLLESGELQTGTGAFVCAANLLCCFTCNTPDGGDERIRQHIGFVDRRSRDDIHMDVCAALKNVFSPALCSRLGAPIVFDPLEASALAAIVQRGIVQALKTAVERLHLEISEVTCEPQVGASVIAARKPDVVSSGARGLLELGRTLATAALMALLRDKPTIAGRALRASFQPQQMLDIQVV